ncbi:MAG: methylmalonyl-CoA mutase family protein [bacterium]|nr:methylmalonyl-CoA mutase family protein [bacterium]MDT8365668.1 methylmalonyl-CoA mutase family protein [bacterium]
MSKDMKKQLELWESETYRPAVEKRPERKDIFTTISGQEVKPLYTPADVQDLDYTTDLGFPGEFPFTRGVRPSMYRGQFWTMRQYAGFGTAQESNLRYRYLLDQGQTGLSVAFDLPTQMGYDSDHPMAEGEVGRVGVAIDSLDDVETLFDQIPLDKVSTSMTINSTASTLLSFYAEVGAKQGVASAKLRGTIQNDVLKEYIARGTYIFPPAPSMRIITDIFAYCIDQMPQFNTISISGYHMREAGSTAAQEVAFTLADGIAYVQAAIESGLDVDLFASRLSFFFNVHNDFLEEVAKFRAARRLWAGIMRDRFAAKNPNSWMLRFHTQTAGCSLTAQQPENNVVRVAIQALAAVLGGTQSLHTNSRDEALALPTEDSVRIALRTQQIIASESGVASTIDPLAGSYAIEALTGSIEAQAGQYIERIDQLGGAVKAIDAGFQAREIEEAAYRYQMEIESGDQIVVGVNAFTVKEEGFAGELLKVDPELEKSQVERVRAVRSRRNQAEVDARLKALEDGAKGHSNLMPLIRESVSAYATLGEVSDSLRRVFGIHRPQ